MFSSTDNPFFEPAKLPTRPDAEKESHPHCEDDITTASEYADRIHLLTDLG
jgi:hypothetical protein